MKEKLLNHKHTTPSLSDNWQSITLPPFPPRKSLGKAVDLPSLPSWTVSRATLSQVFSHYSQPLPRNWPGMIRLAVADCSNGSKHSRPIRHYLLNILWLYCCVCVCVCVCVSGSGSDAVDTIKEKRWVCCMFLDSVVCVCVGVCVCVCVGFLIWQKENVGYRILAFQSIPASLTMFPLGPGWPSIPVTPCSRGDEHSV